jgi:hypothetical protein
MDCGGAGDLLVVLVIVEVGKQQSTNNLTDSFPRMISLNSN